MAVVKRRQINIFTRTRQIRYPHMSTVRYLRPYGSRTILGGCYQSLPFYLGFPVKGASQLGASTPTRVNDGLGILPAMGRGAKLSGLLGSFLLSYNILSSVWAFSKLRIHDFMQREQYSRIAHCWLSRLFCTGASSYTTLCHLLSGITAPDKFHITCERMYRTTSAAKSLNLPTQSPQNLSRLQTVFPTILLGYRNLAQTSCRLLPLTTSNMTIAHYVRLTLRSAVSHEFSMLRTRCNGYTAIVNFFLSRVPNFRSTYGPMLTGVLAPAADLFSQELVTLSGLRKIQRHLLQYVPAVSGCDIFELPLQNLNHSVGARFGLYAGSSVMPVLFSLVNLAANSGRATRAITQQLVNFDPLLGITYGLGPVTGAYKRVLFRRAMCVGSPRHIVGQAWAFDVIPLRERTQHCAYTTTLLPTTSRSTVVCQSRTKALTTLLRKLPATSYQVGAVAYQCLWQPINFAITTTAIVLESFIVFFISLAIFRSAETSTRLGRLVLARFSHKYLLLASKAMSSLRHQQPLVYLRAEQLSNVGLLFKRLTMTQLAFTLVRQFVSSRWCDLGLLLAVLSIRAQEYSKVLLYSITHKILNYTITYHIESESGSELMLLQAPRRSHLLDGSTYYFHRFDAGTCVTSRHGLLLSTPISVKLFANGGFKTPLAQILLNNFFFSTGPSSATGTITSWDSLLFFHELRAATLHCSGNRLGTIVGKSSSSSRSGRWGYNNTQVVANGGTSTQCIRPYTGVNVLPSLVHFYPTSEQSYNSTLLYTIQRQAQVRLNYYLAKFIRKQTLHQPKTYNPFVKMFNAMTRSANATRRMYGPTPIVENVSTVTLVTDPIYTSKGSSFISHRVLLALALRPNPQLAKFVQLAHPTHLPVVRALSAELFGIEWSRRIARLWSNASAGDAEHHLAQSPRTALSLRDGGWPLLPLLPRRIFLVRMCLLRNSAHQIVVK